MSGYLLMMDDMPPDGLWDCDEESMEDGTSHGMRPIRAQLRTGWKRMAEARWIAAGDGSRPEMDRGRIWIATGYGWMTGGG